MCGGWMVSEAEENHSGGRAEAEQLHTSKAGDLFCHSVTFSATARDSHGK